MTGKRKPSGGITTANACKIMTEALKKLEAEGCGSRPKFNGYLSEKAAVNNYKRKINVN